jgi:hypothetical protein
MRNVKRIMAGKLEGNIPFGRYRLRWEDDIKIELS